MEVVQTILPLDKVLLSLISNLFPHVTSMSVDLPIGASTRTVVKQLGNNGKLKKW